MIVKREIKTDIVGAYVCYTYADGHIETEPANRPIMKEDVARTVPVMGTLLLNGQLDAMSRTASTASMTRQQRVELLRTVPSPAPGGTPNAREVSRVV